MYEIVDETSRNFLHLRYIQMFSCLPRVRATLTRRIVDPATVLKFYLPPASRKAWCRDPGVNVRFGCRTNKTACGLFCQKSFCLSHDFLLPSKYEKYCPSWEQERHCRPTIYIPSFDLRIGFDVDACASSLTGE